MTKNITKTSLSHFSHAARKDGPESGALELIKQAEARDVDITARQAFLSFLGEVRDLYDPKTNKAEISAIDQCQTQFEALI